MPTPELLPWTPPQVERDDTYTITRISQNAKQIITINVCGLDDLTNVLAQFAAVGDRITRVVNKTWEEEA